MIRFAMNQIAFYHNPRCSKSRAALALLEERGSDIRLIEYLKTPPTTTELERLATQPGVSVREMMHRNKPVYRELGLSDPAHGAASLLRAIAEHPILLQRSIAVASGCTIIAHPPGEVLEL